MWRVEFHDGNRRILYFVVDPEMFPCISITVLIETTTNVSAWYSCALQKRKRAKRKACQWLKQALVLHLDVTMILRAIDNNYNSVKWHISFIEFKRFFCASAVSWSSSFFQMNLLRESTSTADNTHNSNVSTGLSASSGKYIIRGWTCSIMIGKGSTCTVYQLELTTLRYTPIHCCISVKRMMNGK